MLLKKIFDPFVKERPICVMARAVLERLLNAERINALFQRVAERQYTRELLFSQVAELMSEVTLGLQPAVHAAYQARMAQPVLAQPALRFAPPPDMLYRRRLPLARLARSQRRRRCA